jgi:dihydrofolate reductase
LKRFKARTMGHTLVMGRKTFASMGRALPGRRNFVISRNPDPSATQGVEWFTSLEAALAAAQNAGETECFIAGGTAVYAEGLKLAGRMYITFVRRDTTVPGDAFFPPWDEAAWHVVSRAPVGDLEFVEYQKNEPKSLIQ